MTLQELFGIELPIIQAPMAGVAGSVLAIAVCNAGGLGSLPCALLGLDVMRKELTSMRAQTHRPFNVNFFCHPRPAESEQRELAWKKTLLRYYEEFRVDPDLAVPAPPRLPFSPELAYALAEFRPAVVSFHFGLPAPDLVARVRGWGGKIISSATTLDEALWLEERGVDAIIAQGLEAGGHRGMFLSDDLNTQVGTFALVPQIVKAVKVPVIAAGGIADASGVAAAMALGAAGVQVGTAYMLCPEANTSVLHRKALKSASGHFTALTNLFSGRPARAIVNRLMRELGPINPGALAFPLAASAIAPLRTAAEVHGDTGFSALWAGQNTSGCKEISASALTQLLASHLAKVQVQ
jgi:nitronate monooxygenase